MAPCNLSTQECPLYCGFRLPTNVFTGLDFKEHLLIQHSCFIAHKSIARGRHSVHEASEGLPFDDSWPFEHTDLTRERLVKLQREVVALCKATKPPDAFSENHGYLRILHLPDSRWYNVCSRCTHSSTSESAIERHLILGHVDVWGAIPADYLDEVISVRGLRPQRMTSPRLLPRAYPTARPGSIPRWPSE